MGSETSNPESFSPLLIASASFCDQEAVIMEAVAVSGICKQVQRPQPQTHQATQMTGPLLEAEETRTGGGEIGTGMERQNQ